MFGIKDIEKIGYFSDILAIDEIKQGYKGRKKYKIITKNKNYFLKIHHYRLSQKEIIREKNLYKIYENLRIPTVPLLDIIEYKNQTIFLYPFFEGTNLKEANLNCAEYYQYGIKVGEEVIKLQKLSVDSKLFSKIDLNEHFTEEVEKIKKIWKNQNYQSQILQIFSKEELKSLAVNCKSLLDFMKMQSFSLNHNDIKITNVMLDQNNKYYLIDIDPINLTPIGFNMCYSIYVFLLPGFKESEKVFLKGFIQTIDPMHEMLKQLQYFLILDMINESEKLLNYYFKEIQENKEYMKNMLFNKERFLEKMIYEE